MTDGSKHMFFFPRSLARSVDPGMDGFWYDPLHGGCLRRIRDGKILGVYGNDERTTGAPWFATYARIGSSVAVDFAGKPGKIPQKMTATLDGRSLRWSDGNVWKRLYMHRSQCQR